MKNFENSHLHKSIFGQNAKLISHEDNCYKYQITSESGEYIMTIYEVFSGIYLQFNDVHLKQCSVDFSLSDNILEITHCKEGRAECSFNENFFYMESGDLSIVKKDKSHYNLFFPTNHYHGISIILDLKNTPHCLSCFLDDVNVNPATLMKKFCNDSDFYISRSHESIAHIFSELYSIPDKLKKGYFKVKILELMLFLTGMDFDLSSPEKRIFSQSQVALAKEICEYLSDYTTQKITIAQLSEVFHISPTAIKNCFKGVYGMSVSTFIRTQKMNAAAKQLVSTDYTVLDIAGMYGYDNSSKFAAAFKSVMGTTPFQYRLSNS